MRPSDIMDESGLESVKDDPSDGEGRQRKREPRGQRDLRRRCPLVDWGSEGFRETVRRIEVEEELELAWDDLCRIEDRGSVEPR